VVQLQHLLVVLLGFITVTLLFIDDCQVEKGGGVRFFMDGQLQEVDRLSVVFLELIVEDAQVKVGLEVFWIDR